MKIKSIIKTILLSTVACSAVAYAGLKALEVNDTHTTKKVIREAISIMDNAEPINQTDEVIIKDTDKYLIRGNNKVLVVEFKRYVNPYELADKHIVYKDTGECFSNIEQTYLPSTCSGYVALEDRTITPKQLYQGQGQWANGFEIKDGKLLLNGTEIKPLTYHDRASINSTAIHFTSVDGAGVAVEGDGTIIQTWTDKTVYHFTNGTVLLEEGKVFEIDGVEHIAGYIKLIKGYAPDNITHLMNEVEKNYQTLVDYPTNENLIDLKNNMKKLNQLMND